MSHSKKTHKLGQFTATAICGNDILSSTLYVSGLAVLFAGLFAPFVLVCVGIVLLLYRQVYLEVVGALPVNGGAYNALLNSTSKIAASVAGTMTVLSYIATAVISAKTAVAYLVYFIGTLGTELGAPISYNILEPYIIPATLVVLFGFMCLVLAGVKDSAKVAAGIFALHLFTLVVFVVLGSLFIIFKSGAIEFAANWEATKQLMASAGASGGLWQLLFLGFSVSLLGISGFESSANFVEEQKTGVFPKTLRNMIMGVVFFNPIVATIALALVSTTELIAAKDFMLAVVGHRIGGFVLLGLVGVDAFLVLSGAVLAAFIGVSGLMERMALDSVLPQLLVKKNKRGVAGRVVILFFILCATILLVTHGNLLPLAGVYSISFLSVMTLFAIGNIVLRRTRPELKRPYRASLVVVLLAALATTLGLVGNILVDNKNIIYFLMYFVPAMLVIFAMLFQKDFYASLRWLFTVIPIGPLHRYFDRRFNAIAQTEYYVFIHHTSNLFRALEYIHNNEGGDKVVFVHCKQGEAGEHEDIKASIPALKKAGVFAHVQTKFKYLAQPFGPKTVRDFAAKYGVPLSRVFIGSVHESHRFTYEEFGGVRIILE